MSSEFSFLVKQGKKFTAETFERTGSRPISCNCVRVFNAGTSGDSAFSNYSGNAGRWREYDVYVTDTDKLVVYMSDFTQWQGEKDRFKAHVFTSINMLKKWLDEIDIGRSEQRLLNAFASHGVDLSDNI